MNFENITIGQVVTFITTIGIIAGFMYKIFSVFNQVKTNKELVEKAHKRIDELDKKSENQKNELLNKVEETNDAVNLLCSAISAMIDNQLNDNSNSLEQLREIKRKLDDKKEIV